MKHIKNRNESSEHIFFLINSMGEGGAQRILLSLVEEYLHQGVEITVITLAKNDLYRLPDAVHRVYLCQKSDESSSLYETLLIPYYAWKLRKYIKNKKLITLQSHLFRANFVNILAKLFFSKHKVQIVNHSVMSRFFKEGLSGRLNLFLIKFLYPKADSIIYISKRMQEDFLSYVKGITTKGTVIYNPYNIPKILEESQQSEGNFVFDDSKFYLITVGRMISLKRFEDVLLALSGLSKEIELIMLGEGEKMNGLKKLAKELGILSRVHFLGQVPNPYFYISNSQLLISSSSVEGFPNVLVEAMVCRTAIIATDCISGPREILAPSSDYRFQLQEGLEMAEFGILYVIADVEGLKRAITLLREDNALREAYEAKAFEQSKRLSVQKIAKVYRENFLR